MIAAGGTGGHVMPALAVADALRARGAEVGFIGVRGTGASGRVREAGFQGFLRKPVTGDLLEQAIARVVVEGRG